MISTQDNWLFTQHIAQDFSSIVFGYDVIIIICGGNLRSAELQGATGL